MQGVPDPLHCYNPCKHWRFLRSWVLQTRYKVLQPATNLDRGRQKDGGRER